MGGGAGVESVQWLAKIPLEHTLMHLAIMKIGKSALIILTLENWKMTSTFS